jgi:hypothetical protein
MNKTTPSEYMERFRKNIEAMYEITARKNHDYSWTEFAFRNFETVEDLWICSVEEWILVRMVDKMTRISNLIDKTWQVADEKVEDTLLDLANYALILKIYRETKL